MRGAGRLLFTPAEDALLGLGLTRFGPHGLEQIRHHFLPTKTVSQLSNRKKNLASKRARPNPIKVTISTLQAQHTHTHAPSRYLEKQQRIIQGRKSAFLSGGNRAIETGGGYTWPTMEDHSGALLSPAEPNRPEEGLAGPEGLAAPPRSTQNKQAAHHSDNPHRAPRGSEGNHNHYNHHNNHNANYHYHKQHNETIEIEYFLLRTRTHNNNHTHWGNPRERGIREGGYHRYRR